MTRRIDSHYGACVFHRVVSLPITWYSLVVLLLLFSMGCSLISLLPPTPTNKPPTKPVMATAVQSGKQVGFEKSDCRVAGITFPDITTNYNVDDIYDGPYLICNASTQGLHNLQVHYYINITAYKAAKLDGFYQEQQKNIQGFVDQANELNANPDVPAEAKDEITFIRNDSDGYIFMITREANVQQCENGSGYGVEKVNGKYLVQLSFQSCELPDAAAYTAVLKSLETAALTAIQRVETASKP